MIPRKYIVFLFAGLCAAGYYCSALANTSTPLDGVSGDVCPAGHYCPAGSPTPLPCPDGKVFIN